MGNRVCNHLDHRGIVRLTGIAADSAAVAKILFFIALAIFVVLLVIGLFVGKRVSR